MYAHTTSPSEADGAVPSAWALAHDAQHIGRLCAPAATVETTVSYRRAARINSGKHVHGQVLLKGLLLSKRLDVSRLLLKSNHSEESFWRRSPVGVRRKFLQLCVWRQVQDLVNNLKDTLLLVIQGQMKALS